jgi:hypothetical protein
LLSIFVSLDFAVNLAYHLGIGEEYENWLAEPLTLTIGPSMKVE